MARRDVVVIGASAGGVEALKEVVAGLPADFPGTVLVVLHMPVTGTGALADILDRAGPLPARRAEDGDRLESGTVLVAQPGRHLAVLDSEVTLTHGPRENGHRPAVDVLFRSAAHALGSRVVGVVLSGALDDGAAGMVALRLRGGVGVVQDPHDAQVPDMPRAAIEAAVVEYVLPAGRIPELLVRLVSQEFADTRVTASDLMAEETKVATEESETTEQEKRPGKPSALTCPDCNGPLYEIVEGTLTRYRCRVGHAWSQGSLAAQQTVSVENALWTAMETLSEKATLREALGERADDQGQPLTAEAFRQAAEKARSAAAQIRAVIEGPVAEPEAALFPDPDENGDPVPPS
jgi:two-component system, chemotaxis family, protein-glutamate methylesterase/glutaminase